MQVTMVNVINVNQEVSRVNVANVKQQVNVIHVRKQVIGAQNWQSR